MKLESLKITNIRSVKKLDLEFPITTILFYGDIGSGKSSILKAIEFGLFGTMGDLSASSLLRRGQNNAEVEITFSIDGNRYTVHRELKKKVKEDKETITQPQGWLIENDVKTSYTTTELRVKLLEILNYSTTKYKSASKKCVDIFRYTVYTPQEEIKAILLSNPEERFEILKDVLEIEKYQNSKKNLDKIKTDLSKKINDINSKIEHIGSPETEIPEMEKDIEDKKNEIQSIKGNVAAKREELTKEKIILKSIEEEYNTYTNKVSEISANEKIINGDKETIEINEGTLQELDTKLSERQGELDSLPKIEMVSDKKAKELEGEIKTLRSEGEKISEDLTNNQKSLADIEKLLKEGKCSLCGQTIHDKKRFDEELENTKNNVDRFDNDLKENKRKIKENEDLLNKVRESESVNLKRKGILEVIKGLKEHRTDLSEMNKKINEKIKKIRSEIERALKSYNIKSLEETEAYKKSLEENRDSKDNLVEKINEELTLLEKALSSHETDLTNTNTTLEGAKVDLKSKQELKKKLDSLTNLKTWASDQFPILLDDIKRAILATTASHFNKYFKEWFRALVEEENIDIQIDPEIFQPIVIVDGYESPFNDLSGGERSALSLAYRLALNKVINTKHQDVKTKDLLILDEPTEGFSEQQVKKMQSVFDSLDVNQMIIISHEKTLDSFVSKIFEFKKVNHQTKVTIKNI